MSVVMPIFEALGLVVLLGLVIGAALFMTSHSHNYFMRDGFEADDQEDVGAEVRCLGCGKRAVVEAVEFGIVTYREERSEKP